jgi:hypothetical protein
MIDLSSSSDEENLIVDTAHDVEFTRKLFGDLNCDILRPPGDGNIIILNDSDEEKEEVREEKMTSAAVDPASTASPDNPPVGAKNDNSDDQGPD